MKTWKILALLGLISLTASFLPRTTPEAEVDPATALVEADLAARGRARGRALFLAKGCSSCHRHDDAQLSEQAPHIGPNLSSYDPDPEFVERWLRDPAAVRPYTLMPNLNLDEAEIDALIAFLAEE